MESRQSLILCLVYAIFLILGAVMFMFLEYTVTETRDVKELKQWTRLKELALQEEGPEDELLALAIWLPKNCTTVTKSTIDKLVERCDQVESVRKVEEMCPHLHIEDVTVVIDYPWSFIDALYFSMTVSTTIGYGHISPSLTAGRVMCMIYAVVGIPMTGILLAWTSEFFGEQLFKLFKSKLDKEKQHSRKVIALATCIYIAIGFVVFIFLPAVVFMSIEKWTYLESVYYAFITLTTIGFGDFVTGSNTTGGYLYVYQVAVILWIMIGLGYWVMVANFITKALKSKRLQSSVLRSAEEMKKLMQQMGIKNHDPTFLRQHSKATVNFMLQLSNIIAIQGGVENGSMGLDSDTPDSPSSATTSSTSPTSPFSPVSSPMGIPGISALFGPAMNRTNPLGQLIGPLGLNKDTGDSNCTEEITTVTFMSQNDIRRPEKQIEIDETANNIEIQKDEEKEKEEDNDTDPESCSDGNAHINSEDDEEHQHNQSSQPPCSPKATVESHITLKLEEEPV